MVKNRTPKATKHARKLRNTMTEGERRLWRELREFKARYDVHVRRQVPIGPCIADFAVLEQNVIIEIDGQRHFTQRGLAKDARRDKWLADNGYRVLRVNTGELSENLNGCVETIMVELGIIK